MTTIAPDTGRELPDIPAEELLQWLADMTLIRAFEQTADGLALRGKIPGGMHPAIGQEAVAVGAARALRPADIMTGTHRSHHHALARQLPPAGVLAELYGKASGINSGRGGSMHLADFERGLWGSNGIVGAGLGVALGAALGASVRSTGQVALGFFGDGGANTGRVWEFVNLAAIWSLPLIIACENNLYAVETTSRNELEASGCRALKSMDRTSSACTDRFRPQPSALALAPARPSLNSSPTATSVTTAER